MSTELDKLVIQIKNNDQMRQGLSQIRALIKTYELKQYFYNVIKPDLSLLTELLNSEDAKTRKNAALLIGDMAEVITDNEIQDNMVKSLFASYKKEGQLFVKSSYLTALKDYDYRIYLDELKQKKDELSKILMDDSTSKHIIEEMHTIHDLIIGVQGLSKHVFTGGNVMSDIILLTNRRFNEHIAAQVAECMMVDAKDDTIKTFPAGVIIHTDKVDKLMKIRTFNEMLYQVSGMAVLPLDPIMAADQIADSRIMDFLHKRHNIIDESAPFYFRIEMKSSLDLGSKSTFVKKMSNQIEKRMGNKLLNNKSNYELEIRIIETKTGKLNCLVKLFTQEDIRFKYRKRNVAASIKPDNAALLVELSKEYMIPNAQVLDPFCGTGAMLIERQKIIKANTSYGIDIYKEAIDGAKVNTESAGQIIHFINKDYFDFNHEYLFDEIITDMPFETGHKDACEIENIYKRFFLHSRDILTGNGRIIMYTHNRELVDKYAGISGFKVLKHDIILEKAGTDLYILEVI